MNGGSSLWSLPGCATGLLKLKSLRFEHEIRCSVSAPRCSSVLAGIEVSSQSLGRQSSQASLCKAKANCHSCNNVSFIITIIFFGHSVFCVKLGSPEVDL